MSKTVKLLYPSLNFAVGREYKVKFQNGDKRYLIYQ